MALRFKLLSVILSATALTLAGPPHDIWPLALVGLIPLLEVLRRVEPLQACRLGVADWHALRNRRLLLVGATIT